jgi:hypothetical protein
MKTTSKEQIEALTKMFNAQPKNMNDLVKTFDLEIPKEYKPYNILIDDLELDNGRIVINSAKVLSESMQFVRFADMSRLIDQLDKCNIIFNVRKQGTT